MFGRRPDSPSAAQREGGGRAQYGPRSTCSAICSSVQASAELRDSCCFSGKGGVVVKLLSREDWKKKGWRGKQRARSAEQHFPAERLVKCGCLVFLLVSAAQTKNQLHLLAAESRVPSSSRRAVGCADVLTACVGGHVVTFAGRREPAE